MEANLRPTESAEPSLAAPLEQASRAGLEQAFALFNQMSTQLSESYTMMEARVAELKGQLALVSAQRMQELAEKERLANNTALARSIRHRFPYIDPLHHLQVELIRRWRDGQHDERVQTGIHISINGIAAGLRNTG